MILTTTLKDKIKQHAISEAPKECCGVVVLFKGKKKYIPCQNIKHNAEMEFEISPQDMLAVYEMGEVIAIVHSHGSIETSRYPTEADKVAQAQSELTWIMYNVVHNEFHEWSDGVKPSLYGREYIHGVMDCYSFVRDFYQQEFGIVLTNYAREDNWWHKGQNLYSDNYEGEGFRKIPISEVEYGDLLVMTLGCSVPNHGAIYVGNNKVAHHATNRLSCIDIYGSFLRDRTAYVLRHKERD